MCKQFNIYLVKLVTSLLNILLIIMVVHLIYVSVFAYLNYKSYENVIEPSIQVYCLISIVIGVLVLIVIIVIFVGMVLNGFGILFLSTVILLVLGLIFLFIAAVSYGELKKLQANGPQYYLEKLDQGFNLTQDPVKMVSIDALQSSLYCCGLINGPLMYFNESVIVPPSCCKDPTIPKCNGNDVWESDCMDALTRYSSYTNSRITMLLLCCGTGSLIVCCLLYVLSMAVRQYYYY